MTQQPSTPLHHYFIEPLEVASIHRQVVDLTYTDATGQHQKLKSFVDKFSFEEGRESVRFKNGVELQLTQIVRIEGYDPDGHGQEMLGCRCGI